MSYSNTPFPGSVAARSFRRQQLEEARGVVPGAGVGQGAPPVVGWAMEAAVAAPRDPRRPAARPEPRDPRRPAPRAAERGTGAMVMAPAPPPPAPVPRARRAERRLVVLQLPAAAADMGIDPALASLYRRTCLADSARKRREAPLHFGSLDLGLPESETAWQWAAAAEALVVYQDIGVTPQMQDAADAAVRVGTPVEYRTVGREWYTIRARGTVGPAAGPVAGPAAGPAAPAAPAAPVARRPATRARAAAPPPPTPPASESEYSSDDDERFGAEDQGQGAGDYVSGGEDELVLDIE
jgi:hypothetical protein